MASAAIQLLEGGSMAHMEIATAGDLPTDQPPETERSWFGIVEVVGRNDDQPTPVDLGAPLPAIMPGVAPPKTAAELAQYYTQALQSCVETWRRGQMTDVQAEFLGACVRARLLPNTLAEMPEALTRERRRISPARTGDSASDACAGRPRGDALRSAAVGAWQSPPAGGRRAEAVFGSL